MLELYSEVEAITTSKNNVVVINAVWKERQRILETFFFVSTSIIESYNNITVHSFEFLLVVCCQ
jgi:hypothetical protein